MTHAKGNPDLTQAKWQQSTVSPGKGNRVEVAFVDDLICVRDSDTPEGSILVFTEAEWNAFVLGVKDGEFDF